MDYNNEQCIICSMNYYQMIENVFGDTFVHTEPSVLHSLL